MKDIASILLVGRNKQNLMLLENFLSEEGYPTSSAASLEEVDRLLDEQKAYSLALLDLAGLDRGIWKCCERLKNRHIPFIAIYPKDSDLHQEKSLAQGVMVKPLSVKHLLRIVKALLENEP